MKTALPRTGGRWLNHVPASLQRCVQSGLGLAHPATMPYSACYRSRHAEPELLLMPLPRPLSLSFTGLFPPMASAESRAPSGAQSVIDQPTVLSVLRSWLCCRCTGRRRNIDCPAGAGLRTRSQPSDANGISRPMTTFPDFEHRYRSRLFFAAGGGSSTGSALRAFILIMHACSLRMPSVCVVPCLC